MDFYAELEYLWLALFPGTPMPPAQPWKEDADWCKEANNGWEPIKDDYGWIESSAVASVLSDTGVAFTHYRLRRNRIKGILGIQEVTEDYYEVTGMAYTPATREQPEDADPYLVGFSPNLHEAFLVFIHAHFEQRLQAWSESQ